MQNIHAAEAARPASGKKTDIDTASPRCLIPVFPAQRRMDCGAVAEWLKAAVC
jgi:hypothetical protein